MALVSRAHGTFYGQRTGGAPHRRAVFIGFGPLAGGAAGARERSLKSSHFVAPLRPSRAPAWETAVRLQWFRRVIITTMNIERFKQRLREKEIELQSEMERLGEEVRVSGQAEVGDPADAATSSQGISESLQEDTLTSQTL